MSTHFHDQNDGDQTSKTECGASPGSEINRSEAMSKVLQTRTIERELEMRQLFRATVLFVVAATLAWCWSLGDARAGDDVYNFYFQKAPGPTTVIQGGKSGDEKTVTVKPEEAPAEKPAKAEAPAPEESKVRTQEHLPEKVGEGSYKTFELSFGVGQDAERNAIRSARFLGFRTNFSERLGIQAQIIADDSDEFAGGNVSSPWNYSLLANIVALRAPLGVNKRFEFNILAGLKTIRTEPEWTAIYDSNGDYRWGQNKRDAGRSFKPALGMGIGFDVVDNFAFIANVTTLLDNEKEGYYNVPLTAQAGVALRF